MREFAIVNRVYRFSYDTTTVKGWTPESVTKGDVVVIDGTARPIEIG